MINIPRAVLIDNEEMARNMYKIVGLIPMPSQSITTKLGNYDPVKLDETLKGFLL